MEGKVEIATVALTLKHPFWASLLFDKMVIKPTSKTPVAATDGKYIYLNPANMETRSNGEVVFIVAHEIGHAMFRHMARFKDFELMGFEGEPFDRKLANVAADYVINAMLKECRVGTVPKDALLKPEYTANMSWTEVYRDLRKKQKQGSTKPPPGNGPCTKPGNQNGQGGGKPDGKSQPGSGPSKQEYEDAGLPTPMDEHLDPASEHAEDQTHSDEGWELAIAAAAHAQKSQGDLPGALQRLVDELLEPKHPWQELLRAAISQKIGRDERTWRRPRRRSMVQSNIYLPGSTSHGSGTLVIMVDTSGSISQPEFNVFCSELQAILEDAKPEQVHVLFGDAKVQSHVQLESWDDAREAFKHNKGGGGTDFRPFWKWLDKENIEPDTAVIFTDTHGSWPAGTPFPLIVCSTVEDGSKPNFPHKYVYTNIEERNQ